MKILFISALSGGEIIDYNLEPGDRSNLDSFPPVDSIAWILADLASGKVEEYDFYLRTSSDVGLAYIVKPHGIYKALIEYLDLCDLVVTNNVPYNISLIIADVLRSTGFNISGFAESTRLIDLEKTIEAANPGYIATITGIFNDLFSKQIEGDLNVKQISRAVACSFFKLLSESDRAKSLLPAGVVGSQFFDLDFTDGYNPPKYSKIRPFYV